MQYRPEIDGLRALAVTSVILYHAEMVVLGRDWFEGGFIGVDVFFVISGYLIAKILMSELFETGRIDFLGFYERRARRILPMLFATIVVSMPFAWAFMVPSQLTEYAESIISALLFGSNFFFYFATTEYGAESALLKPFLHTWSLGIEEQFYIVFPLLLIACARIRALSGHMIALFAVAALASLQFAEVMSERNPMLSFFLPVSRFWELLAGAAVAWVELKRGRPRDETLSQVMPVAGLALVLFAVFAFDKETVHPGYATAAPVAGVALVILFANGEDLVSRILSWRPFVVIGLISYSLYLWHYPAFAFGRINDPSPDNLVKLAWIAGTFAMSILSYLFVERPFRNRKLIPTRLMSVGLAAAFALVVAGQAGIVKSEGAPQRFADVEGFLTYERDNDALRKATWSLVGRKKAFDEDAAKVLVVGNSHAKDIFNALHQNAELYPGLDFVRGPVPQISCFDADNPHNRAKAEAFFASKAYAASDAILVSTQWIRGQCNPKDKSLQKSTDLAGLPHLIERAKADGKGVVVMGNTVQFDDMDGKWVLDRLVSAAEAAGELDAITLDEDRYQAFARKVGSELFSRMNRRSEVNRQVRAIAEAQDVSYFDKFAYMCDARAKRCEGLTDQGRKVFYDYGHYTLEGARFFGERMARTELPALLEAAVAGRGPPGRARTGAAFPAPERRESGPGETSPAGSRRRPTPREPAAWGAEIADRRLLR